MTSRAPRRLVLEEHHRLAVSQLRRLLPPRLQSPDGPIHVSLEVGDRVQELVLEPQHQTFGTMLHARCACGRLARFLYLDPLSGCWRCSTCLRIPSARDRLRRTRVFRDWVRPLLDLERARKKLAYHAAAREKKELFARMERAVLERLMPWVGE